MNITCHDRIKLQNSKAVLFSLHQAVRHQFFSDMKTPGISAYCIAGVADMSASSYIIGMKNIKAINLSAFLIYSRSCICLLRKKISSCGKATPSSTTSFQIRISSGRSFSSYFLTVIFTITSPLAFLQNTQQNSHLHFIPPLLHSHKQLHIPPVTPQHTFISQIPDLSHHGTAVHTQVLSQRSI